ncbi:MAG: hypothetical protein FWE24_03415 [Defluviitaleaceae bacterium]|nr:hypothetical protein [Defluviitaleaceae bacterium]
MGLQWFYGLREIRSLGVAEMTLSRLKNIIIAFLVFLALDSTSSIWFEDTGGSFLTLFARNRPLVSESGLVRNFAFPMRIIAGNGDQQFHMVYTGMSDNKVREFCDEMLISILGRNDAPRIGAPNFGAVLSEHIIIYEYAFEMPAEEFIRALGLRSSPLTQSMERFNQIVFSPSYNINIGVNIYFHNRNTGAWVGFFAEGEEVLEGFFSSVESMSTNTPGITWASSFLLDFDPNPYNNLFIPTWGEGGHHYLIGEVRPAHFDSTDGALQHTIRMNLMSFFDNPAAVYDVRGAVGPFAWADGNTIVRHFNNNVVEYVSYRRDNRNTELLDDFANVLDFIAARDVFMTNDFYLSGFEERNNERIFFFDYILDGLPVIFTDALKNYIRDHTANALTVRFRDGNLVAYTRLAYELTLSRDILDTANRDLPLYILNSGLDLESLESITLAFAAPQIDSISGVGIMNLWVDFRMQDGISSMESLRTYP